MLAKSYPEPGPSSSTLDIIGRYTALASIIAYLILALSFRPASLSSTALFIALGLLLAVALWLIWLTPAVYYLHTLLKSPLKAWAAAFFVLELFILSGTYIEHQGGFRGDGELLGVAGFLLCSSLLILRQSQLTTVRTPDKPASIQITTGISLGIVLIGILTSVIAYRYLKIPTLGISDSYDYMNMNWDIERNLAIPNIYWFTPGYSLIILGTRLVYDHVISLLLFQHGLRILTALYVFWGLRKADYWVAALSGFFLVLSPITANAAHQVLTESITTNLIIILMVMLFRLMQKQDRTPLPVLVFFAILAVYISYIRPANMYLMVLAVGLIFVFSRSIRKTLIIGTACLVSVICVCAAQWVLKDEFIFSVKSQEQMLFGYLNLGLLEGDSGTLKEVYLDTYTRCTGSDFTEILSTPYDGYRMLECNRRYGRDYWYNNRPLYQEGVTSQPLYFLKKLYQETRHFITYTDVDSVDHSAYDQLLDVTHTPLLYRDTIRERVISLCTQPPDETLYHNRTIYHRYICSEHYAKPDYYAWEPAYLTWAYRNLDLMQPYRLQGSNDFHATTGSTLRGNAEWQRLWAAMALLIFVILEGRRPFAPMILVSTLFILYQALVSSAVIWAATRYMHATMPFFVFTAASFYIILLRGLFASRQQTTETEPHPVPSGEYSWRSVVMTLALLTLLPLVAIFAAESYREKAWAALGYRQGIGLLVGLLFFVLIFLVIRFARRQRYSLLTWLSLGVLILIGISAMWETAFRLPLIREKVMIPLMFRVFPDQNMLAPWGFTDAEYQLCQDLAAFDAPVFDPRNGSDVFQECPYVMTQADLDISLHLVVYDWLRTGASGYLHKLPITYLLSLSADPPIPDYARNQEPMILLTESVYQQGDYHVTRLHWFNGEEATPLPEDYVSSLGITQGDRILNAVGPDPFLHSQAGRSALSSQSDDPEWVWIIEHTLGFRDIDRVRYAQWTSSYNPVELINSQIEWLLITPEWLQARTQFVQEFVFNNPAAYELKATFTLPAPLPTYMLYKLHPPTDSSENVLSGSYESGNPVIIHVPDRDTSAYIQDYLLAGIDNVHVLLGRQPDLPEENWARLQNWITGADAIWYVTLASDDRPVHQAIFNFFTAQGYKLAHRQPASIAGDSRAGDSLLLYQFEPRSLEPMYNVGTENIHLNDWSLSGTGTLEPCQPFALQTWWQADQPLNLQYTLALLVMRADNTVMTQVDQPIGGWDSTAWQPGQVYFDERELILPCDLAPGEYDISLILYTMQDGQFINQPFQTVDGQPLGEILRLDSVEITSAQD